ncbi:MAG: T9SS type A sorting domain-containing protein [Bacteroidales bacterium]|nr:T9SS type A sorting domain-containing protein [Bacteroidales bacterium]
MRLRLLHLICVITFPLTTALSQIPNGQWRDHLPYSSAIHVAEVENKIFCSTTGGLLSYDTRDGSTEKYTKIEGLSDVEISTIEYSKEYKTFIVAYENGNIDLIRNDSIINIPDIKLKLMSADKRINNILIVDNIAYLACGFGIVSLNLVKAEIHDTYLFGEFGSQINTFNIAFDGIYIYAATEKGIYMANINSPNLVDYYYWQKLSFLPEPGASYKSVTFFNSKLYTLYKNPATQFDDIIIIEDETWHNWEFDNDSVYKSISVFNNILSVCSKNETSFYNTNEELIGNLWSWNPQHAILDNNNVMWIADQVDGFVKNPVGGNLNKIFLDGPKYKDVGHIVSIDKDIWVAAGKESNKYQGLGAFSFKNGKWKNYDYKSYPELSKVYNISKIAIDPTNKNHVMGGSFGYGLVEFIDDQLVEIYDETNSILRNIEGYTSGYIRVTGLDFDQSGNLYFVTSEVTNPAYVLKSDHELVNFSFQSNEFGSNTRIGELIVTSWGHKWMLLSRKGIFIFDDHESDTPEERMVLITDEEGKIIDQVFSITEDLTGNIWIGTNKGPVVYYNPQYIFNGEELTGYQIKIPRNDGSGLADILLENEQILDIVVDGANRKWIATANSGVFLMSEDGREQIYHFNEENSPIFSDHIVSIGINHKTGEVFIGTEKGLISFMGQATAGADDFENVYVYPNPVRENYEGDITITGLVSDVNVKITDISGNLVYETTALGGQAIWNGKNFKGNRVNTGIYLVFCTNEDGSKTFVTKLLFIH